MRLYALIVLIVLIVLIYSSCVYAQKIVTDGLVSFWPLDKDTVTGNAARDIIGSNHGKINGGPKIVAGKVKEAMLFDGVADFLDCGTDESLNLTDAITIETWIKPASVGEGGKNAGPVCKAQTGAWGWQLRYNAPSGNFMGFQFNAGGSVWISVEQKLGVGEWYHIMGTFDGSEAKCYLNGVEKSSAKFAAITSSPDPFFIGQDGWLNVFDGAIDEVRIYNRGLSKDEVLQNYNAKSQLSVGSAGKLVSTWGIVKYGR